MRKLLFLLTCSMFMECCTIMPNEEFFCTISTKDIPDVSVKTLSFSTDYIDYHFPECGTVSYPLFDYDIKYDTLSHYRVVVLGSVVFGEEDNTENVFEILDSVKITRLVVDRLHSPRELYGKNGDDEWISKNWEECPLPNKILKKIRKDFLIRMKYKRYFLNKSDNSPAKRLTTSYPYRLY